ncbi:MAG TPA: HAD family hydrolase [bacterium]|nr:HAD family hydrolase [bacterium]
MAGAFFDVDYTVLSSNSATLFVKYLRQQGKVGARELLVTLYWVARYKLNLVNFEYLALRETRKLAGQPEREMIELCNRWFDEMVIAYIYQDAVAKIEEHRKKGDTLVLLTAATTYLTEPLARRLRVPHFLCNRLEVDEDGNFTGELIRPFSYGAGKLVLAERFAAEHGLDLGESYYYSDSITDLPVLEGFRHPMIVNPDPLLRREARRRNWPVLAFKS